MVSPLIAIVVVVLFSCACSRTLPLSLLIGVPIVAASYLLVNVSFFAILTYDQILSAQAVALVSSIFN